MAMGLCASVAISGTKVLGAVLNVVDATCIQDLKPGCFDSSLPLSYYFYCNCVES
jgi:hypothetical protein